MKGEIMKVGDRVRMTAEDDGFFTEVPGTLIEMDSYDQKTYCLVRFDKEVVESFSFIHFGAKDPDLPLHSDNNRCWNIFDTNLKKVGSPQLELFQ